MGAKPPPGLSARARRLWAAVLADYELSPAEVEVLAEACTALDRAEQAAGEVRKHGVTLPDRYGGRKANPAADVEARNRALFARLVAQLGVREAAGGAFISKPGPRPAQAARRR